MYSTGFDVGFDSFTLMDRLFPIFFIVIFVIIIGVFASVIVGGLRQWSRNNAAPRLAVQAVVRGRRTQVSHTAGSTNHGSHAHTTYYVTFEVESGDRIELQVSGTEYGMLIEGDRGTLHFQGTRYQGFDRV